MEGGMLILTANGVRAAKLEDRVVKGFHFRNGELRIISGKLGSPEDREEEEDAQPQTQASSHASRPASLDFSRSEPSLSEQIPAQESSLASRKPQDTITQTSTAGDYVSANIQRASSSSYTGEKQQSNTFYINNTKTDAPAPSPAKPPAEEHLDTLQKLKKLRSDLAATPPAFTAENTSGVPPFLKERTVADALREPQGYPREGLAAASLSAEISTAALDNPAVNEDVQKIKALADYSSKIEPEIKGLLKQAGEEAANVEAVERLTQLSNDIAGQLEDTQGWNKEMHETNAAAVRNALLVELKTLQQQEAKGQHTISPVKPATVTTPAVPDTPTETPVAMTSDQIHPAAQPPELPPLPPTRDDGVSPQPPPAASGILQEPGSRFNEALLPINTSAPAKLSTTDTQVNSVTSPISPEEGAAKEPTTTGAAAPPPLAAAIDTKPPASAQPSTFQEQVPVQESGLKPWQMRAEVYAAPDANTSFEEAQRRLQGHRGLVREALARGENVPLEVLAAYPDLTNESSATTKHDQPVNRENPWWDYGDAYKEMVNPLRLSLATSKATAEDIKEGYDKQYEREIAVSDEALREIQRQNAELAAMQARQLPNPPPAPPERSFLQRLFGGGGKKITAQPTTTIETTAEKSAQNPPKSGFLNKPISEDGL